MVINDNRRKAIFIHIPKCGGVSIEKSIHKALGGDDVAAYVQLIRRPPNPDNIQCKGLFLHSTLSDFRRYYGNDIDNFFIFSVVRNPWRRMVSHWEYLTKQMYNKKVEAQHALSFTSFIQVYESKMLGYSMQGYKDFLEDDGRSNVNYVARLENIKTDIKEIEKGMKLEIPEILHMNQTDPSLKEHKDWRDYYNPWTKNKVYEIFKADIEKYEYEFK